VFTNEMIATMSFREFAEYTEHKWVKDRDVNREEMGQSSSRKFMSRYVNTSHWVLKL